MWSKMGLFLSAFLFQQVAQKPSIAFAPRSLFSLQEHSLLLCFRKPNTYTNIVKSYIDEVQLLVQVQRGEKNKTPQDKVIGFSDVMSRAKIKKFFDRMT